MLDHWAPVNRRSFALRHYSDRRAVRIGTLGPYQLQRIDLHCDDTTVSTLLGDGVEKLFRLLRSMLQFRGLSVCLSVCHSLAAGKRLQCGPVLRYKDALKVNLKQCGIDPSALGDDTQDRSAWRTLCHEAVTQFEDSRVEALEHKRAVRKAAQPRSNLSAWPCDSCSRVCSSRIGLHAQSTNSPMTSDPSFSTAQSVPFRSATHVRALCSNGRKYRHDFLCTQQLCVFPRSR